MVLPETTCCNVAWFELLLDYPLFRVVKFEVNGDTLFAAKGLLLTVLTPVMLPIVWGAGEFEFVRVRAMFCCCLFAMVLAISLCYCGTKRGRVSFFNSLTSICDL